MIIFIKLRYYREISILPLFEHSTAFFNTDYHAIKIRIIFYHILISFLIPYVRYLRLQCIHLYYKQVLQTIHFFNKNYSNIIGFKNSKILLLLIIYYFITRLKCFINKLFAILVGLYSSILLLQTMFYCNWNLNLLQFLPTQKIFLR